MAQPHLQVMNEQVTFSQWRIRFSLVTRRFLLGQINSMQEALARVRDLWTECAQLEENSKRSVAELESENRRLGNTAKWLANQNQELQRQVESHKSELERATDAREIAVRKLENTYRVIRDLINEVERLQVANGLQLTSQTKAEESEEMRQIIGEAMAQSISSGSSDSDRTPRQYFTPLRRGVSRRGTPKPGTAHGHRRHGTVEGQFKATSHSSSHLPSPETSGNESVSDSGRSSASSFANVDDDGRWSIHYGDRPPGVCDLVFLNDPIFLEERAEDEGIKKTYILDWGTAEENARLTNFIWSKGGKALHTFVFPKKKKKWYYVGSFTWHVANHIHAIWPSFEKTSRKKVLSKLCERSLDYDETDVAAKLDGGRLSQICIEISSDGLWEVSREFASVHNQGMLSQTHVHKLLLLLVILIVLPSLFLPLAPDMRQQSSIQYRGRHSDLSPRQKETNTTQAAGNSTTTPEVTSSKLPPSNSSTPSLHSSTTSISVSSSSTLTTSRRTTSIKFSSSTRSSSTSTRRDAISESTSSDNSSLASSSSHPSITPSISTTVSISSSAHTSPSLASVSRSSSVTPSITSDPTPRTTLTIAPASSTSISPPTLTHINPSPTSTTSSPSTHGFWANKGAVAGTFTAVSLIIVGAVVAFAIFLRRRSQTRDTESYEGFTAQSPMDQLASGKVTPHDAGGFPASPGLSVNDLATQDPINPHASSQAYSEYAAYVPQGLAPIQERGSEPSTSLSNSTFKRPSVKRSSYQPSIDSFYGAPGA
ncbi:hypothetical protein C0995_005477 [Termitomyces sp. Mi166|nr:hypothetical protein C0995_005477 [Termitomyces sp. Mi166\